MRHRAPRQEDRGDCGQESDPGARVGRGRSRWWGWEWQSSAWEPTGSGPTPVPSHAITVPSHEPDALARPADALGCVLADNATLDPMVFTGASEKQAVDALTTEVEVRAQRWEGTLPWIPSASASEESAWLAVRH